MDFTNQLRADGAPLGNAIDRAGEIRFLPILLTSATAIGGLISSTLLARLVRPVMYRLIPPEIDAAADRSPAPAAA